MTMPLDGSQQLDPANSGGSLRFEIRENETLR